MDINVRKKLEKININGTVRISEPMAAHTTFKTGGKADIYFRPDSEDDLLKVLRVCRENSVPCFILGGGANILVSDSGIEGCVVDMGNFTDTEFLGDRCKAGSGLPISDLAAEAGNRGLSGLEFIYSMPGSTGGAVWMNARCYGESISDVLFRVKYLDEDLEIKYLERDRILSTYDYKKSFFQGTGNIILGAEFILEKGDPENIKEKMEEYKRDRERKGHFRFPCAGSVFKNNRSFGRPTGAIIDSLGLKGKRAGDACIADFHGNIIINRGKAASRDIRDLVDLCYNKAEKQLGIQLECEIQFIGRW